MADLKVLRIGDSGEAVEKWQYFLLGQGLLAGKADGDFGPKTYNATIAFQQAHQLNPDGVVGNKCYGAALLLGFDGTLEPLSGKQGANWPPKPAGLKPLANDAAKFALFGHFAYESAPVPGNPEHIKVTGNWQKENIVAVSIPQLKAIAGVSKVEFHKNAAAQLQKLWSDWEAAGLLHLVLTWAGTYNPRFIRGSRTVLSNHAFGTAFDINVPWNALGAVPALVGQKGSVRELVAIANENGLYWGGHFTRLDGMHFEIAELKS
jgi:peptidoglycan hydrolase-like protein with peptidoglycan-binding domain